MTPVISLLKTSTIIEIQTKQITKIKPKPLKYLKNKKKKKKKEEGINHRAGLQIHNDNLNPRKNNSWIKIMMVKKKDQQW